MESMSFKDYKILALIGQGNFGVVHKALHIPTSTLVAIKFEKSSKYSQTENEIHVLKVLESQKGFPKLLDSGQHQEKNFIVMPLLGESLHSFFTHNRKTLSTKKILSLALQCLFRIQTLHIHNFIHRDLKPQQFLLDSNQKITLIDFGLCKKFLHNKVIHIPYNENRPFLGTLNYASLNTHMGIQQSRRDDLESFCYVLSFMVKGKLPWSSSNSRKSEESEIKRMKSAVKGFELFADKNLEEIFRYVRGMTFEQEPDYQWIVEKMNKSLREEEERFVEKVRSSEVNEGVSVERVKRKGKKKSQKLKRSNCKTFNELALRDEDNSVTEVCDEFPEFKNRRVVNRTLRMIAESRVLQEKYNCRII